MRYAEVPSLSCEVYVEAAPSRVWSLVTDIALPARLSPELQRVEWLGGVEEPAVGARFAGYARHRLLGEWRTVSHVVELEEQRVFCWAVVDEDGRFGTPSRLPSHPLATWRFELAPDGAGTRLRHLARMGPGRSGVTLAIEGTPDREEEIVAFRITELRGNMEATLHGVKALAERAAQTPHWISA
ncbi:SRPBCC family protein [Streptomyces guryensis]|uniref:SRPBCC family protein n=1 Tax=Streptomyces guryensis TaxID=2886947 RepID=A0A9Q3VKN5_9ACTN|nr:SRPBCC family protein [Streptomyces guryensis]MCD9873319.1 SRPBCC family protein [Streptomyces guryensis]